MDVNSNEAKWWSKSMKLRSALEAILPFADNTNSPGGCDGTYPDCPHCAAIRAAREALKD
jgi:hypothetical protein